MAEFRRGAKNLRRNAKTAARRPELGAVISRATDHAIIRRREVMQEIDFAAQRRRIQQLRQNATQNLPGLLDRFKARVEAKGFHFHMAVDTNAARRIVIDVAKRHTVQTVVKSKSMLGEEVGIREALEQAGIQVTETDLGEYIVQLNHEPPSHLTAPAVHLSTGEVGEILYKQAGIGPFEKPEQMAVAVRQFMRTRFFNADMGMAGANALIAETGAMLMMSNEGNIRLVTSLPRLLVVLTSVDKLVERMADLAPLIRVIPKNATGQRITNYCTVLSAPRQGQEVHIVVVNNNRMAAAGDPVFGQAIRCVRCAACINVCPVFRTIGGHAYGTVYVGPMGIVLTNALHLDPHARMLSDACTLCDACAQVCPAGIDLPGLILHIRSSGNPRLIDRFKAWVVGMTYAGAGRFKAAFWALRLFKRLFAAGYRRLWRMLGWTGRRGVPRVAGKTFDRMWDDDAKGD